MGQHRERGHSFPPLRASSRALHQTKAEETGGDTKRRGEGGQLTKTHTQNLQTGQPERMRSGALTPCRSSKLRRRQIKKKKLQRKAGSFRDKSRTNQLFIFQLTYLAAVGFTKYPSNLRLFVLHYSRCFLKHHILLPTIKCKLLNLI